MNQSGLPEGARPIAPLDKRQRRVLGVLIEKAFCTPEQYPLTANSVVTACNQKSNRDPVTNFPADVIDEALLDLQRLGLVIRVIPTTGRTDRWKHHLKDAWNLERPERAVLAELLLRGHQTEGELRTRASRMVDIPSLEELQDILTRLAERQFVRRVSPDGRRRGVMWTHLLYLPEEMAQLEQRLAHEQAQLDDVFESPVAVAAGTGSINSMATGRGESLVDRVARAEQQLEEMRRLVGDIQEQLRQLQAGHDDLVRELHGTEPSHA